MKQYYLFWIILWTYVFEIQGAFRQPHIIFIIVDDLGWNDVSFHGSLQIPTPNIDAIAQDGLILNNYYVQPICTPSRGALMTGKYPLRLGLQHNVIAIEEPYGLSRDEKILPQYLKDLGYEVHGIGKWHLGFFHEDYIPTNRGFQSFFGYWNGKADHFTHSAEAPNALGLDFHDNEFNAWNYTGNYSTEIFTLKAKNIIQKHNTSQPLFLYLAHQAVHSGNSYAPLQAPDEYVERFNHIKDPQRRLFAGMTSSLDDSIGDIFDALDSSGMLNDSLIIFTTDNGAAVEGIDKSSGSNWPLRGSKYNMWEGGIRGVAFVWSSQIRDMKRRISNHLIHISDWLPTIYSVAGGNEKNLPEMDGFNQWPTICCNESNKRNKIVNNIDDVWNVESIRKDRYKLVKGSVFNGQFDGWFDKEGKKQENTPFNSTDLKIQSKVYHKLWNKSKVSSILHRIYGKSVTVKDTENFCNSNSANCSSNGQIDKEFKTANYLLEVKCGLRPDNYTTNCQPMKSACLFDIETDPCEYNNLAENNIQIVKDLELELEKYRKQAVPIVNKEADPLSNPKFHDYAWVPWIKNITN